MRRAARVGWVIGAAVALALTLWIFLVVQPVRLIGGWIGIIVAALYLAHRIAREIGYGAMRLMNRRAVEAVPPSDLPEKKEPQEGEEV